MVEYKGYRISYHGKFPKFLISSEEGPIPDMLKGGYRSVHSAQHQIDVFYKQKHRQAKKPKPKAEPKEKPKATVEKVKSDGETEGSTGS